MHESEKWNWSRSVMSDSLRPHGLQPTRLLCPWDFPGKSTGVGCHCLLRNLSTTDIQILSKIAVAKKKLCSMNWAITLCNLGNLSFWLFLQILDDPLYYPTKGFIGGSVVKSLPAKTGDTDLIPGLGRFSGERKGNPLQYSCLKNPKDRGTWWAIVHGIAKNQTGLSN